MSHLPESDSKFFTSQNWAKFEFLNEFLFYHIKPTGNAASWG